MLATIRLPSPPQATIGPHCDDPYSCPLKDQCWRFLPEQNVADLYGSKKKGFGLLERGITALVDIPAGTKLTDKQAIQKQAAITGKPHVYKAAITGPVRVEPASSAVACAAYWRRSSSQNRRSHASTSGCSVGSNGHCGLGRTRRRNRSGCRS